jgi:hypothetical protein
MGSGGVNRFFKSDETTYEQIRLGLDAAWGHGVGTGTVTCFEPAATAPRDSDGLVVLAVRAEFCDYEAVAAVLPGLLASGTVVEISESEYRAAVMPD